MEKSVVKFNKDMNIGEVIKAHAGAEKIVEKYFGNGCFTCPGMNLESITFGATMHGIDADAMVKELNELE
ncbi:MAG: DUF1858 domain-containing protein [Dehalococcoidales bacterium]